MSEYITVQKATETVAASSRDTSGGRRTQEWLGMTAEVLRREEPHTATWSPSRKFWPCGPGPILRTTPVASNPMSSFWPINPMACIRSYDIVSVNIMRLRSSSILYTYFEVQTNIFDVNFQLNYSQWLTFKSHPLNGVEQTARNNSQSFGLWLL